MTNNQMKTNTEAQLKKLSRTIRSKPELLTRILATIEGTVTTRATDRLFIRSREASEGRVINTSFSSFMTTMWKIGIPVAALVLVVVGAFLWGGDLRNVADESDRRYASDAPAAEDVDEIVAALSADADAESAAFAEESEDAALVENDSAELTSVSNSYEAREF